MVIQVSQFKAPATVYFWLFLAAEGLDKREHHITMFYCKYSHEKKESTPFFIPKEWSAPDQKENICSLPRAKIRYSLRLRTHYLQVESIWDTFRRVGILVNTPPHTHLRPHSQTLQVSFSLFIDSTIRKRISKRTWLSFAKFNLNLMEQFPLDRWD